MCNLTKSKTKRSTQTYTLYYICTLFFTRELSPIWMYQYSNEKIVQTDTKVLPSLYGGSKNKQRISLSDK
ncbi:hypothetical protein DERF_012605 [Dermatophagoides farinae]|uniref:Uncharacterized protein n=1 Tax=Dermatophagoides farinae TaxID=6954 RepID=A0A922HUH1_DERFA|nr:hypothetical protein DERF_012605 [Dermatophagoides farinae]